jgi:hypothetical protein
MLFWLPLLICLVGGLMYGLASPQHTKAGTIGLHMFWVGLLAFLLEIHGKV